MTSEVDAKGFSVTECIGGSMELADEDLGLRYQSFCDPRLNHEQSLDIGACLLLCQVSLKQDPAFLVSQYHLSERSGRNKENEILKGLQSRSSSRAPPS
jgi:hypothetical protein